METFRDCVLSELEELGLFKNKMFLKENFDFETLKIFTNLKRNLFDSSPMTFVMIKI